MKKQTIALIVLHLLCSRFFYLDAQVNYNKDSLITSKINTLEGFWKKYNQLSSEQIQFETTSIIPDLFKVKQGDTLSRADYLNKVNDARIKQLKNEFGLAAVGNYQENFNPGIGVDDELVYNRRFQLGLDWNVLADGYISSRYKQLVLKNEKVINSLTPTVSVSANDYLVISHKVIYAFNEQKIKLLEKRQQIINDKLEVANELYLLKHLAKLDMMQIIQQQVDVTSLFQIYKAYNMQLANQLNDSNLPKNSLPLFDIEPEKLLSFTSLPANDSILKLQIKNLELENKVWKDVNLKTQLRYNYYDMLASNRDFLSAGLSVSVPLPLGTKARKNVVESRAQLLSFDQKNESNFQSMELLNLVYEFRYKLKQYNNFYEKHKRYEELIRVERVKEKLDDLEFNPVSSLNLLDEMLSVEIEMLDLQQEMYLKLLDILTKTPGTDALSIIKPFKTQEVAMPTEMKEKSIYIWSEAQEKYDVNYIEEYLRLNKIGTAIVSVRKDAANKIQAIALFDKLHSVGVGSELLVGSNKLLTDKNPLLVYDSLIAGLDLTKISALHLDVEPHTLPDWDANKDKHFAEYIELLKKTKNYCTEKGIKLNVSIPVFYPENVLKDIYTNADNVYVMAYEHNDSDFIIRKVKEEMAAGSAKTVIALRAKDFKNRNEFEKVMNEIGAALNASRFAMHDFSTFVKLDEISVGGSEK